ncbi:hypothetical protein K7X08_011844 [Anisodus acutangulus]|uniref:Uncharacterized protein n=1 Tax=Anisodus acutangulus TaxID=402998 RepID=A0A9Q1QWI5_9SOLA|nr:hypothetical protein K7X08_011844 [Anisodus acutangulus]
MIKGDVNGKNKENSESHRRYLGRTVQKYLPRVLSSGNVVECPSTTHKAKIGSIKGVPGDNKKGEGPVVKVYNQFGALDKVDEDDEIQVILEVQEPDNSSNEKLMTSPAVVSSKERLVASPANEVLKAQANVEDGSGSLVISIATDEGHANLEA